MLVEKPLHKHFFLHYKTVEKRRGETLLKSFSWDAWNDPRMLMLAPLLQTSATNGVVA